MYSFFTNNFKFLQKYISCRVSSSYYIQVYILVDLQATQMTSRCEGIVIMFQRTYRCCSVVHVNNNADEVLNMATHIFRHFITQIKYISSAALLQKINYYLSWDHYQYHLRILFISMFLILLCNKKVLYC